MQACHHCDVPACVNPDHLFVGTPLENTADMISKGRVRLAPVRGSQVGGAVLTEHDIPAIRARLACGETLRGIAASYGLTEAAISCVKLKKTWRHVE
jgi:acyl-CoA synthetase (AMP-forming)/AMP-acid ligase II